VAKRNDAAGSPINGEREINEAEATVIRRIFREFGVGKFPRAIARDLNAEAIAGPQGGAWIDTTIRGHATRGTGIVNNELYVGKLIWNRLRYIKDPDSGKRVSRMNPKAE
jgi:site-specific DNA recombinase